MSDSKAFSDWSSILPEAYIKDRVDEQIEWYDNKSATNKIWLYRWQVISLIATSAIPVLALLSGDIKTRILVASLGALASVAAGFLSMYQFRDQWIEYRTTSEMLKYERFLFVTASAPYNKEDSFSSFVNRIESIIIKENSQWVEKISKTDKYSESSENDLREPYK